MDPIGEKEAGDMETKEGLLRFCLPVLSLV